MIKAKWWNKRKASYQGGSKPLLKKRRVPEKPDSEVTKKSKKKSDKPEDPIDEEALVEVEESTQKEEEIVNPVNELLSMFDEAKKKEARKKLAVELRSQKDNKKVKRKKK